MTTPPRTEIEVLRPTTKVGLVAGIVLMLGIAGLTYWAALTGDNSTGTAVVACLIGSVFGLLGLGCLARLPRMLDRHSLIVDHEGLQYVVGRGPGSFRVSWAELRTVSVSVAQRRSRTNTTVPVRLDLLPEGDVASFLTRHPEMTRMQRPRATALRLPLGPNRYLIDPLADALHTYAGPRDGGIQDDGRASGFTYV